MALSLTSTVILLVGAVIGVVVADIRGTTVHAGDCVCATTGVNARDQAGLSGSVVVTLATGQCGTIFGGILTKDGYKWYEIKFNGQRVWVAGRYLSKTSSSSCGSSSGGSSSGSSSGSCSSYTQQLACALLQKHNAGVLDLATRHPSGVPDNAYAYNNIRDVCNGKMAARSSYSCSTCPTGTPGGYTCLTPNLLNYLTTLVSRGRTIVNEIAGACHSCNSRHYNGQAVDLHNDARTREYIETCQAMDGWALDEGDHVHCQFYD